MRYVVVMHLAPRLMAIGREGGKAGWGREKEGKRELTCVP